MLHKIPGDTPLSMLMRERGLSQSDLAKSSGVPQPTISRFLASGGSASVSTLLVLAAFFSVDVGTLCAPRVKADSVVLKGSLRPDLLRSYYGKDVGELISWAVDARTFH